MGVKLLRRTKLLRSTKNGVYILVEVSFYISSNYFIDIYE